MTTLPPCPWTLGLMTTAPNTRQVMTIRTRRMLSPPRGIQDTTHILCRTPIRPETRSPLPRTLWRHIATGVTVGQNEPFNDNRQPFVVVRCGDVVGLGLDLGGGVAHGHPLPCRLDHFQVVEIVADGDHLRERDA